MTNLDCTTTTVQMTAVGDDPEHSAAIAAAIDAASNLPEGCTSSRGVDGRASVNHVDDRPQTQGAHSPPPPIDSAAAAAATAKAAARGATAAVTGGTVGGMAGGTSGVTVGGKLGSTAGVCTGALSSPVRTEVKLERARSDQLPLSPRPTTLLRETPAGSGRTIAGEIAATRHSLSSAVITVWSTVCS